MTAVGKPAEGTGLGFRALVGTRRQHRREIGEALIDPPAIRAHQHGLLLDVPEPGFPILDTRPLQPRAVRPQQIDLLRQRPRGPRPAYGRRVFSRARHTLEPGGVDDAASARRAGPVASAIQRAAQSRKRQVGGRAVSHAVAVDHGDHRADVERADGRLRHAATHREMLVSLFDEAKRAEVDRGSDLPEAALNLFPHAPPPRGARARRTRSAIPRERPRRLHAPSWLRRRCRRARRWRRAAPPA